MIAVSTIFYINSLSLFFDYYVYVDSIDFCFFFTRNCVLLKSSAQIFAFYFLIGYFRKMLLIVFRTWCSCNADYTRIEGDTSDEMKEYPNVYVVYTFIDRWSKAGLHVLRYIMKHMINIFPKLFRNKLTAFFPLEFQILNNWIIEVSWKYTISEDQLTFRCVLMMIY